MSDILHFKIHRAEASRVDGKTTVRLYYPRNPELLTERLKENISFGVKTLNSLINEGYAEIANQESPIKPAAAGSLYVLKDGNFICHRRDAGAPTHKLYHGAYAGYTNSLEGIYSEKGLMQTALRETAEECLLITKDVTPWLIVPKDSKHGTLESAKRIGLNLRSLFVDVETLPASDTLEVYYEGGEHIFTTRTFLDLLWESQASLNALQLRRLPFSLDEVLPVDAEYFMNKEKKPIHINRESYILHPSEIPNSFGRPLNAQKVYQTRVDESGIPKVFTPQYEKPYLGPDKLKVTHPHVWAPEDLLTTCLDALSVEGYKGRKQDIELWKERTLLERKSLLPGGVLV